MVGVTILIYPGILRINYVNMNAKEKLLRIGLPVAAVLASIGVGFAGVTSAQSATLGASTSSATNTQHMQGMWGGKGSAMRPGVFGKVTAIAGTSLTVEETNPKTSATTDYTVDALGAKVIKAAQDSAPAEASLSAIAVGDSVAIRGTVSGTSVSATEIMDGAIPFGPRGPGFGRGVKGTRGTVTSVSGNTITLTGKDGKTYTVDAGSAQIAKVSSITVGSVQVGDTLDVQGDVSGTTVTAKHIMDGITENPQQ